MTSPSELGLYATGPFQPFNFTECLSYPFVSGTNPTDECHREQTIERVALGYFTFSMINAVYILFTTGLYIRRSYSLQIYLPSPRDSEAESTNQDYEKHLWRRRALSQRGLLSTVFSGLGCFIITSTFLFKQAFDVEFPCFVYFGLIYIGYFVWLFSFVWRAMRLRFLLKLNEVKYF